MEISTKLSLPGNHSLTGKVMNDTLCEYEYYEYSGMCSIEIREERLLLTVANGMIWNRKFIIISWYSFAENRTYKLRRDRKYHERESEKSHAN